MTTRSLHRTPPALSGPARGALAVVLALLLLLAAAVLAPTRALAATDSVENLDVAYVVNPDGSMHVTETYTYAFNQPRHGIERYVLVRQGYGDSTTQHRQYPMSDISVSSPTGAPAQYALADVGGSTVIRVGDPDRTITGTQRYVISYTLGHVLNKQEQASAAELYWNVTGDAWRVPIQNVSVSVTGPAAATKAACTWGASRSTDQCGAKAGATSTYTAGPLSPGQQMTIAQQMPLSAFGDLAPQLGEGSVAEAASGGFMSTSEAQLRSYGALGLGLAAPVLALLGLGSAAWRRGRDERFVDIAPDIVPSPGEQVATTRGGRTPTVAVRFNPPDNATPGLIGTLVDEEANTIDVSATVLDLAVRGFLRIEQVDPPGVTKPTDWRLIALKGDDGTLLPYERTVLDGLFSLGSPVMMSDLRTNYAATLARAQGEMYSETVRRGWFRQSPHLTRQQYSWMSWLPFGLAVVLAVMTFMGSGDPDARAGLDLPVPTALIGIAGLVLAGILGRLFTKRMPARTAVGSAMLQQTKGFREYLLTAEAGQIKFEEAANIFSRYLPYAVVFGCADRWAKLFAEVAAAAQAQGYVIEQPTFFMWYGGYGGWGDFGRSVDSFSTSAAGTFVATPGSSGESAFGSGGFGDFGGFSGGGGGGGGGGSW